MRRWVRRLSAVSSLVLLTGLLSGVMLTVAATPAASGASSGSQTPAPSGYWEAGATGGVFSFGAAGFHGSMGATPLDAPVVGMAATPSSTGYWEVAADGGVFAFGNAGFYGSMAGKKLNAPIVGMAATPGGNGYWLVAADGGVFAFGTAGFYGSMGGIKLNAPVVGMAAAPTGNGYWLVAADGGVFNFGSAAFYGSMGGQHLVKPVVGMAALPGGSGYWLVAADGGIFSFGEAPFFGSMGGVKLSRPVVGMAATSDGAGYWLAAADGGIFSFGDAMFRGSMADVHLNGPVVGMAPVGPAVGGKVLLVGTYNGIPGQYTTIQAAVDAAQPGDWILIAPGDYHSETDMTSPPTPTDVSNGWYGGVEISTPDIHLRGMDRNTTVIDGTLPGSPQCSSNPADQNPGPTVSGYSEPVGQNGIVVWKADNVSIQNLTVCNYQNTTTGSGNEIFWNGGWESGKIGMSGYSGSYLTATDSFDGSASEDVNGTTESVKLSGNYGIFSASAAGPGIWNQIYANNFVDSDMYVGACQQACDAWINNAWMENSGLGYSGTNSGGTFVISNSQFDNNVDGFDTNTQSVGDPPPPQNGDCPDGGISGITRTRSCWVFMDNNSHNNNNANAPGFGATAEPDGTGMTVSGATNDTVMNNTFANNGAWGTLFVPYPDTNPGATGVCTGSGGHLVPVSSTTTVCIYDAEGDALLHNTYVNDGFFGNPSNGDYGAINFFSGEPQNCFAGNTQPNGSSPADLEQTQGVCGPKTTTTSLSQLGNPDSLVNQVLCDTGFASAFGQTCSSTNDKYPTPSSSAPVLTSVPNLPTMPNPCVDVPANAWCPSGKPA